MKWARQIRALPSDPSANDTRKVEYIDVNLNNSRKLIANVAGLARASTENTAQEENAVESLLRLRNVRSTLSWVDGEP